MLHLILRCLSTILIIVSIPLCIRVFPVIQIIIETIEKLKMSIIFLSMCDVKIFLTFTSPNMVLLWQLFYLFCSCIEILLQWQPEPLNRNESGRFGALKSDSTLHFFRNACTKSGSLRFSQFSGCWLILSVYIIMSLDFPFVRLFGVR